MCYMCRILNVWFVKANQPPNGTILRVIGYPPDIQCAPFIWFKHSEKSFVGYWKKRYELLYYTLSQKFVSF